MLSTKLFTKIFPITIACLIQVLAISCGDNIKLTDNDLEIRDNLIYERGKEIPFTGIEQARVDDKIIEYEIVEGVKHGSFKLYFENGNEEIIGMIDNNANTGEWKYFFESGNLESEGFFVDDMPEGRWVWYYESGKIKEEGSFIKGNRVEWWYQYDSDGNESYSKNFDEIDSLDASGDSLFNKVEKFPF
jgi:antitoxin component YwqK of YwqJK toxin-antitoxin module